jgi:uncharacterized protein YukE
MERFQTHLSRARDDVDRRVQQLHAGWSGTAAAAQAVAHAQWRAGAAEAQEALAVLRSIAATAHANYSAATLANQRMWSR